jgi:hypothetical protein
VAAISLTRKRLHRGVSCNYSAQWAVAWAVEKAIDQPLSGAGGNHGSATMRRCSAPELLGNGWNVAMSCLELERFGRGTVPHIGVLIEDLVRLAGRSGSAPGQLWKKTTFTRPSLTSTPRPRPRRHLSIVTSN